MAKKWLFNRKSIFLIFLLTTQISPDLSAQEFTEQTGISLEGVMVSSVAWGDYDNDGDLDILLTGSYAAGISNVTSKIYKNNGDNTFTEQTEISLTGVSDGSVAWGDYDNDGDLDILLTGHPYGDYPISMIYQNNGNDTFTEQTGISLTGVRSSSVAWGDYDNDGDLDILLTGTDGSDEVSKIYKNNGNNTFTEQTGISLTEVERSSVAWGDYDNDGDLDILLTGYDGSDEVSKIYQNNGGNIFTEQTGISLTGVQQGSVSWGDYDNDGNLDILLTGYDGSDAVSKIYKNNDGNIFTEQTGIILTGVRASSVAWGDYDNDGDLDILLTGYDGTSNIISKIYKNNGDNTFDEQTGILLTSVQWSSVAWGDYDNDGDLDILLTGISNDYVSKVYKNNSTVSNTPPSPPTGLISDCYPDSVVLSWSNGTDNETPQDGLTYNVYLYSERGDTIWSNMADIKSGFRRIPAFGNTQLGKSWTIRNLELGQYYWSVQTVDNAFAGSTFANQEGFNNTFLEQTGISLTGVTSSSTAWGDYDNDGDLDILMTGSAPGSDPISEIYRNNGDNTFTEQTGISLTEVRTGSVAWGDYDNDGDLDILSTGYTGSDYISVIYRNNGDNTFAELAGTDLTGVDNSSAAWGDYDNDGDLDILLTGSYFYDFVGYDVSKIYENNGNSTFTEQTEISLLGVSESSVAWGDYDNDGDLDILLTGTYYIGIEDYVASKIYKNNGNKTFTEQTGISLKGVGSSSVAWGDYDNDGDLDIFLAGNHIDNDEDYNIATIYKNNGDNTLIELSELSLTLAVSSFAWGDYDNDGDLDILVSGWDAGINVTKIYRNNGDDTFSERTGLSIVGASGGSVAWGDYDNDGDLDILLTGKTASMTKVSKIYKNLINIPNDTPSGPLHTSNSFNEQGVLFHWVQATDKETPDDAMSYNLRVGTSPGGSEIISPHSDNSSGFRRIVGPGNVHQNNSFLLRGYENSTIYWSMQSVDHQFAGSPFIDEKIYPFIGQDVIDVDGVSYGSASWGDFDNDSDLDILVTGLDNSLSPFTEVYKNQGSGSFSLEGSINLIPLSFSSSAWGDYNNDGNLDILLTGRDGSSNKRTIIYQNTGAGNFTELTYAGLSGVENGSASWADFDNDGDLDILLNGLSATGRISEIWQNNGTEGFSAMSTTSLTGVDNSYSSCEDYDKDSDLDILLLGDSDAGRITEIYRNEGNGTFIVQSSFALPGINSGFASFGDYNGDGYPDLLLGGSGETGSLSRIYRNNGGVTFTALSDTILPGVKDCAGSWTDFDNDGDLDIVFTGESDEGKKTYFYQTFNDSTFAKYLILEGMSHSSLECGDYNNDSRPDLLFSGSDQANSYITRIYRNNDLSLNSKPSIPSGLSSAVLVNNVTLSWNKSFDIETPQEGLSYNLYIYKQGGDTVFSSMSNTTNGFRKIPSPGNARQNTVWEIENLIPGRYLWSVQCIDQAFEGSEFASEESFTIESFSSEDLINLPGISDGSVAWGDYDNDDDLDILLTGYYFDETDHYIAQIFENNGSGDFYEDQSISMPGVRFGSVAWFDYNNDGNLDIFLTGLSVIGRISKIFKNTGSGNFIETVISLPGVSNSSITAGDYTNDGYEDFILTGNTGSERITKIYRNNMAGEFTEQASLMIPGIEKGTVKWGDYDNDSDLDILLTGESDGGPISKIYQNSGEGGFAEQSSIELTGVSFSSADWGDYDSDGNLDLLITGLSASGSVSKVYQNDGNGDFIDQVSISLQDVQKGVSAWGDFNNDGDLDILVSGLSDTGEVSLIYLNAGDNTFMPDTLNSLANVSSSSAACGDSDNDGDLDLLLTGITGSNRISRIYRNNASPLNTSPEAPIELFAEPSGKSVTLSWNSVDDVETNAGGLSYNVYLLRVSGDTVASGLSNWSTGFRKVSAIGNTQLDTIWNIDSLKYGRYHWSVQSVDNSYKGSEFAPRDSFIIETPLPSAENDSVCFNEPVPTLTVSGSNIRWYADAGLSTLLHSGNSFDPAETEPGVYTYYITQILDDYESQASQVSLTILALPPAPEGNDKEICYSDDISADLSASGQDLKWYDDALLTNLVNSGPTYETGLSEIGIYPFYVTQTVNSCEGSPDTVTLMIHVLPDPIVMDDAVICRADTQYFNIGSAAVAGHSYNWVSDVDGSIGTDANPAAKPLVTTTYTLTETIDSTGCQDTDSVTITQNPNPEFTIEPGEDPIGLGGSTSLSASDQTLSYTWHPGTGLSSTSGAQVTASPEVNTTYYLTGTNQFECEGYDSLTLRVYCPACEENTILVDAGEFSYGCGPENVYMNGLNCAWTLYPAEIPKIYLYFYPDNFDVATGDWVIVYNGAQASEDTLGKFNNDHPPSGNIEGGSSMFIEFITDGSNTGRGFQARWSGDFIEGTMDPFAGDIRIYPNPAVGSITIESSGIQEADARVFLYDNLGRMVLNRKLECRGRMLGEKIDVGGFEPGMYHLILLTSKGQIKRKITITSK